MSGASSFWDRNASRYAASPVSDEVAYERKLAETRAHLTPDSRVLELGCGTGTTALRHAPFVRHIRALDVSEKMLEIARAKAEAASVSNVTFERADVATAALPEAAYDVVMAHSILHLVPDRARVLAAARRALVPGGVLVTSTMCLRDRLWFVGLVAPIGRALGLLPLIRVFGADELRRSVADAGFVIERDWQPAPDKALFLLARAR